MGADEQFLFDLAEAVLEGRPVDWTAAESTISESERALLAHLRAVAGIASFHARSSADEDVRRAASAATVEAIPEGMWGSLRVLERVGQGAFGDVYRAWDSRLDREVALKLVHRLESRPDSVGSHVIDEGRLLARVRHPNVVTVYGADRIDGRVGLWMEFVRGRTLEAALGDQGPFGAEEATLIGLDLCRALSAVHSAGLIHRDVKAQNVMREAGGRIVLMDFGTGRDDLSDGPADLAGTPLYLAPEVFGGAPATAESDIYSVGVLLFHLVTGAYPVKGRTVADLREAHGQHRREWLRDARPDLSDTFVQAVECALDVDPDKRYESAGAMESALSRVMASTGTPPSDTRPARAPQWVPRRMAAMLAVGLALAAIVAVWTFNIGGWPARLRPIETTTKVTVPDHRMMGRPSHDGRLFPFIDPHHNVAVWEVKTDRSTQVAAAGSSGEAGFAPFLSRDGDRVAYGWSLPGGDHELRVSSIDGSFRRTVIARQGAHVPLPVDWSRDGRDILCWLRQKNETADLVLVPVDGGQPRWLYTSNHWPSAQLSPDGRFVLVPRMGAGEASGDLLIIGTDGSAPRPLVRSTGNPRFPTWLPDGRHVFFVRDSPSTDSSDGWIVEVVDGMARGDERMVADDLGGLAPSSFPVTLSLPVALLDDGSLYRVLSTISNEVYTAPIDLDGASIPGPSTRISTTEIGFHLGPSWSPDQKSLAYFTMRPADVAGITNPRTLTIKDMSSGATRHLAPQLSFVGGYSPRWTHDNRSVAIWGAEPARPDEPGYFRVDVRTSETTRVVVNGLRGSPFFQYSPDGREFFYVDSSIGIVARDLTTGYERIVVAKDARAAVWPFAIAPDGQSIAFLARSGDEQTLEVQALGGARRELVRTTAGLVFQAWTPDSHDLLYAVGRWPEPLRLWRISSAGGEPRDLRFVVGSPVNPISVRPDGRQIAYPDREFLFDLWITQVPLGSGAGAAGRSTR